MNDRLLAALDAVGVLLVSAGLGVAAYRWMGWACLVVAGGSVLAASFGMAKLAERRGAAG